VQVDSIKTRVETSACLWFQRLKLESHKLLSTFAINFNLRRHTKVVNGCAFDNRSSLTMSEYMDALVLTQAATSCEVRLTVGWCRLSG